MVCLVVLLALVCVLPVATQHIVEGSGVVLTASATNISYFWANLRGSVDYMPPGSSTVYYGFVWGTTSRGDPGNTAPWMTAYDESWYLEDPRSAPFWVSYTYGLGAFLRPNTTYYYRFCVAWNESPLRWQYGGERSFTTQSNPEGTWGVYGLAERDYIKVETDYVEVVSANLVTLYGEMDFYYDQGTGCRWGFVWGNESCPNPSGWPDTYRDVHPRDSGYDFYEDVSGELAAGDLDFECQLRNLRLPPGTYYFRAVADICIGGDWVYGEEMEFEITELPPSPSFSGLYQIWGYTPSPYPAWYQAWPSILKLLYIGIVLTAAIMAYRYEPKKEKYPDLPVNLPKD